MKQKPYLTKADVDVLLQAANDFAEKNQSLFPLLLLMMAVIY